MRYARPLLGILALALFLAACSGGSTNVVPPSSAAASSALRPSTSSPFQTLVSFGGGGSGYGPEAGLVFDKHGDAFGSTVLGGNSGCGSRGCGLIYELRQAHGVWKERVIYSFSGGSDGGSPSGTLVTDAAGNLYGTTYTGGVTGSCGGCGVVFELTHQGHAWKEHVLYSFTGGNDGNWPGDGVVFHNGNLYGTTYGAQQPSNGSVFELTPSGSGWTETTLYTFGAHGSDGAFPYCKLTFDNQGNIYGDTEGGAGGYVGTVFELSPNGSTWTLNVLARFDGGYRYNQGILPLGDLIFDKNGNLYGATYAGGTGYCPDAGYHCGTLFQLTPTPSGWQEHTLYEFTGGTDGGIMRAGMVMSKGALYGTTYQGGNSSACSYPIPGCGVVFKLTPSGSTWTESVVAAFANTEAPEGAYPVAELTLHKGNLYGTTYRGGATSSCTTGCGTVFKVQP